MRNPKNGQFMRNHDRLSLMEFLFLIYRLFPLLIILIVILSHFDITFIVRKALAEFLCGKGMELCKFDNGKEAAWK